MVKVLSKRLAAGLGSRLQSNQEQVEVFAYGLELVLCAVIKIIVILGTAYILGVLEYTLFYLLSFILLRFFGGGVHLSTYGRCLAVGLLSTVFFAKLIDGMFIQPNMLYWAGGLTGILGLIIILLWAPATTEKKNILGKADRLKQKIFTLVSLGLLLAGVWFLYRQRDYYSAMAMVFGSLVSLYLMTPLGFRSIQTIENIMNKERRVENG